MMSDGWFYAREDEKICGPMSLEDLENILSIVPDPYNLRVWKAGFSDWTVAGAVTEVAALIRTPPRLPETRRKQANEIKLPPLNAPPPTSQNSTAGNKNGSSTAKKPRGWVRNGMWALLVIGVVSVSRQFSDNNKANSESTFCQRNAECVLGELGKLFPVLKTFIENDEYTKIEFLKEIKSSIERGDNKNWAKVGRAVQFSGL